MDALKWVANKTNQVGHKTITIRNLDATKPIHCSISKTRGEGDDGLFTIDPGCSDTWRRTFHERAKVVVETADGHCRIEKEPYLNKDYAYEYRDGQLVDRS